MSRYTVERTLGQGGMATVELAEDEELGRKVAVKRLATRLADDEGLRERFLREAKLAAQLSHPNVVGVYDVGEEDGSPYIVMEYVEGETLSEVVAREGSLQPGRAVDLLLQVCAGLEHAHAAGLVHRDVKPQNLLLSKDGVLKIADFGIARPVVGSELTQIGTVLGTIAYAAPEQAAGGQVTAAADLYSVGAVAHELLTGWPPDGRLPPDVPPALEQVIRRCLATDPNERPQSAVELARELAQASPEPPTQPLPPPTATVATEVLGRPRRTIHVSRRALLGLAGLVATTAIVVGLALASAGRDESPPAQPPPPAQPAPAVVLPRGESPSESARLLAEWLRERAG